MPAPHIPDDKIRAQVSALVVAGVTQEMIGKVIGLDAKTLRKHYHEELEVALEKAIGNVSNTLLSKALAGDTASIIFFLKARGKKHGWSERHELTGPDGGPMETLTHDAQMFASRMARLAASDDPGTGTEPADAIRESAT